MHSGKLSVGIWGIGGHARRRLLPAILQSDALDLIGLCTRNRTTGEEEAAAAQCVFFQTPEEMLADPRIDAVVLSTPTGLHHAHGLAVIATGKHLISEKPLTHSAATTIDLFAKAEAQGVRIFSALMYKHHPQFRAIQSIVTDGKLGAVQSISIKFGMPSLAHQTFRSDPYLGGGALLDVACYQLSFAYQLLPEAPQLQAARISFRDGSLTDTDGWCMLEKDGVAIHCEWGMGRAYQNRAEIWGSDGILFCDRVFTKESDYISTLVTHDLRGQKLQEYVIEAANAYMTMFDDFASDLAVSGTGTDCRDEAIWCAHITDAIRETGHTPGG